MLITRGFGISTGTGTGTGETVYVSVTNPSIKTNNTGYRIVSSNSKLPVFYTTDDTINPPTVGTGSIKTNLDLENLQPKITTNLPKF
jgi:hypothetical protein